MRERPTRTKGSVTDQVNCGEGVSVEILTKKSRKGLTGKRIAISLRHARRRRTSRRSSQGREGMENREVGGERQMTAEREDHTGHAECRSTEQQLGVAPPKANVNVGGE